MSTRRLRKDSYEILERFHTLENLKARSEAIKDKAKVLKLLEHLENVFTGCLSKIDLPEARKFLNSFAHYRKLATENLSNKRVLKTHHLSNLEKAHTNLFNRLKKEARDIDSNCDAGELANAAWLAVAIWG